MKTNGTIAGEYHTVVVVVVVVVIVAVVVLSNVNVGGAVYPSTTTSACAKRAKRALGSVHHGRYKGNTLVF